MKYLKQYSLFETNLGILKWSNTDKFNDIITNIKDILLELEDDGKIKTSVQTTSGKFKTYIGFSKRDKSDFYIEAKGCFYFDDISDYVFRLRDYLPDNIKTCSILFYKEDAVIYGGASSRKEFDLTDDTKLLSTLKDKLIYNLIIDLK